MTGGHVFFIGAGPGAPDLLTLRGREIIGKADLVIYADSLVHPGVAAFAPPGAEVIGSAALTLEQTTAKLIEAARAGKTVARLQSGDPSIYGAMHEQLQLLEAAGVPCTIVPGVSSAFAAAAVLGRELTVPDVSQTVIFTRMAGRTSLPAGERLSDLAVHGATLVIFLSIPLIERVVEELRAGGYPPETPAAVVYRATWEDELVLRGTLDDIAQQSKAAKLQLQALILVGRALDPALRKAEVRHRSNLYDPAYTQRHRQGGGPPSPEVAEP
ncbi:MAG TPA: precorrin-4 C(11)-methyltransferase [Dehalococcoidia bacterium]|nr:precorrin-4 C(11)-methyltransferase [Dehalococcoidia bacterium]